MTRGVAAFVALLLVCGACADSADDDTVLVLAAASLTDAFAEIEVAFEGANPGIDVQLNLAGSTALREQIFQGAPADVFASANAATMQAVVNAGDANEPQLFASNTLVLAVPIDNPAGVTGPGDLADPDRLVGLCAAAVPCGDFARQALDQLGIEAVPDTNELDVRALLTKIEAGELDVGMVYSTDVAASDLVRGIALPPRAEVEIVYPIATLPDGSNPSQATAFVDFVLSATGQQILADFGFGAP